MIERRTFIAILAAMLLVGTRDTAYAQQTPGMWRIGLLGNAPVTDPAAARIYEAFKLALQERGYVEGRNVVIERRFAEGRDERLPALAAELVRLKVDVIVTTTGPASEAAKAATSTTPIVLAGISDPVGRGLVTSLARPGGNITGIANLQLDLYSKRVELLKAAVPKVVRVVSIGNTASLGKLAAGRKEQEADAKAVGVTLVRVDLNTPTEWPRVTEAIVRERPDALILSPAPINFNLRREIAEFARVERLPTIGTNRDQVVAGILMSYGIDIDDNYRHAAVYVDKIFKGAKPSDLPIEQPTKFMFVINMKAAKALGLTIPNSLLLRADELIQ
jgi:putative tryptophan/tyrosine transport system substrate-binding protein